MTRPTLKAPTLKASPAEVAALLRARLAPPRPSRRGFLAGTAGLAGAAALGGCDRIAGTEWGRRTLRLGEDANLHVQRLLLTPASLAREYPSSAVSAVFKPNGTVDPEDRDYRRLAAGQFAKYRLKVDGLVEHPQDLSLTDLRALPARTQITRHDCVEGWSCIGGWTGVPLAAILERAGLKPQARYVVFHCADTMEQAGGGLEGGDDDDTADAGDDAGADAPAATGDAKAAKDTKSGGGSGGLAWGASDDKPDAKAGDTADAKGDAATNANPGMQARPAGKEAKATDSKSAKSDAKAAGGPEGAAKGGTAKGGGPIRYYESIDLTDAYHPQTLLAYDMNGTPLPVSNGAPLRLRVERQLGYKQAKYIMRLEVVDSLAGFGDGKGGYWEDRGYEWYAGI